MSPLLSIAGLRKTYRGNWLLDAKTAVSEASLEVRAGEIVGLREARVRRIRTYAKGMRQPVGIPQAIIGRPKLVILGEPMTGLDPIGRREVRDLIASLGAEGAGIVFSTHVLQDVELVCDRVVIMAAGRVLRSGTLTELLAGQDGGAVEVTIEGARPEQLTAESAAELT